MKTHLGEHLKKLTSNLWKFISSVKLWFTTNFLSLKKYVLADKKRLILAVLALPFFVAILASGYFIFRSHYTIHPSVRSGLYAMPKEVEYYFEIKNTETMKEKLAAAESIKKMEASEVWGRFFSTLAGKKLGDLFYLVQLKSNSLLDWSSFLNLFSESIGYASFNDGTFVVVAKTNLKSKIGLSLLESFKANKKPLKEFEDTKDTKDLVSPSQNTDSEADLNNKIISNESYESTFLIKEIESGNLIISQIETTNGDIYFVLVDSYLFLSDSINTLTKTLETATNPKSSSLLAKSEMPLVFTNYEKEEVLGIFYVNLLDTNFTPFLKPIFGNSDSTSFLFRIESGILTADILTTDQKSFPEAIPGSAPNLARSIPKDSLISIYSHSVGLKEYTDSVLSPGESWPELKSLAPSYFKNGKISSEDYFIGQSPSAFILHKLEYTRNEKLLYPSFSLAYMSKTEDDLFLKAIFKTGKRSSTSFLNTKILAYGQDDAHYTPSLFKLDKLNWISSSIDEAKSCISSSAGNKASVSDFRSKNTNLKIEGAAHHIFINWRSFKDNLVILLKYGGEKSNKYTEKTIESDIIPLLETFQWIEYIHFALGLKGSIYGKLIISPL